MTHRPASAARSGVLRRRPDRARLAVRGSAQTRRAAREDRQERGAVRDRLRPLGPAAYRHLRRSGAHHHGAHRLPPADPRRDPDAAHLLFRRHGRDAEDPGQRAEQGVPRAASPEAADRRCPIPGPTSSRASAHHNNAMLRRFLDTFGFNYEFASATDYYKSGKFDAVLLRAAERYDDIMAVMLPDPRRRAAGDLFAVPADLADLRPRALRADEGRRCQERHRHLRRRGRQRDHAAGHRRPREAAVEARLRHALGRARRRLRDVRQGPPDQPARSTTASARSSAASRPSTTPSSSSSTRTARRFRSPRATASPSTSG